MALALMTIRLSADSWCDPLFEGAFILESGDYANAFAWTIGGVRYEAHEFRYSQVEIKDPSPWDSWLIHFCDAHHMVNWVENRTRALNDLIAQWRINTPTAGRTLFYIFDLSGRKYVLGFFRNRAGEYRMYIWRWMITEEIQEMLENIRSLLEM
jgi:hypothetical protein